MKKIKLFRTESEKTACTDDFLYVAYTKETDTSNIHLENSDPTLLYELPQETTFDGTNTINIGVKVTEEYKDYSYIVDYMQTAYTNNLEAIYSEMDVNSPWNGILFRFNFSTAFAVYAGNKSEITDAKTLGTRYRFVITVNSNENKVYIYNSSGLYKSFNIVSSGWITVSNPTPMLGNDQTNDRYFKGVLYDFKIYSKQFTEEEAKEAAIIPE